MSQVRYRVAPCMNGLGLESHPGEPHKRKGAQCSNLLSQRSLFLSLSQRSSYIHGLTHLPTCPVDTDQSMLRDYLLLTKWPWDRGKSTAWKEVLGLNSSPTHGHLFPLSGDTGFHFMGHHRTRMCDCRQSMFCRTLKKFCRLHPVDIGPSWA